MTTLVFQILSTTVEPSLMATSPQPPPLYNGQFFWLTVHTCIDSCFNLSMMATLFCPQDGHWKEVQLYSLWYGTVYGDQS